MTCWEEIRHSHLHKSPNPMGQLGVVITQHHWAKVFLEVMPGPRSAIGRAPDSNVRGPGFDTWSGNILSFLLPLFQEGQLSVTGESMCTKYWLTA